MAAIGGWSRVEPPTMIAQKAGKRCSSMACCRMLQICVWGLVGVHSDAGTETALHMTTHLLPWRSRKSMSFFCQRHQQPDEAGAGTRE